MTPVPPRWEGPGPGPRPTGEQHPNLPAAPPVPLVGTLPASSITATSASLNGSVNANGSSSRWWFEWGTTTAYGNTTLSVAVTGRVPFAVSRTIGGGGSPLTVGQTYHFQIVAQNQATGILAVGGDFSFVAQNPVPSPDVEDVLSSVTTQPTSAPHFAYPMVLTNTGANVYQQDSIDEIASCVRFLGDCMQGACPVVPTIGVPDLTFAQAPLDAGSLVNELQNQEPRATMNSLVGATDALFSIWAVKIQAQIRGTIPSGTS